MRFDRPALIATLALLCLAVAPLAADHHAQEAPAMPEMDAEMMAMMEAWQKAGTPGEPHQAMASRAGSWKMTIMSWMDPAQPPMTSAGTAERTMQLGGRVLEEKIASDMMGQPFHGVAHSGYDNVTGKHWAVWTDSMSTGVYVTTGTVNDAGAVVYHGEYADPVSGGMIKVRSVLHPEEDGREVYEWYEDRGEGEIKTMEIVYERAGS